MNSRRPHEDLIVWQKSIDLVEKIYSYTSGFPKDERFGLTSQMRRCSISIPANIAEGVARKNTKEYLQFLYISRGSLSELHTYLHICPRIGMPDVSRQLVANLDETGMLLSGLIASIRRKVLPQ